MVLISFVFFFPFDLGVKYVSCVLVRFIHNAYEVPGRSSLQQTLKLAENFTRTSFLSINTSNTNAGSTRPSEWSKTSPRDQSHHLTLDLTCSFIITNSGHHTNHFITPILYILPAHTPALWQLSCLCSQGLSSSCHVYSHYLGLMVTVCAQNCLQDSRGPYGPVKEKVLRTLYVLSYCDVCTLCIGVCILSNQVESYNDSCLLCHAEYCSEYFMLHTLSCLMPCCCIIAFFVLFWISQNLSRTYTGHISTWNLKKTNEK